VRSLDSSVGIVTGYALYGRGLSYGRTKKILSFPQNVEKF
jgi:hypothetical protein